jgi:hypothetical protein
LKIDSRQIFSVSNRQLNLTAYLFAFSFSWKSINILYFYLLKLNLKLLD